MKKVLVTGGAGFIGSHIVDLLLAEGYKVIALDNLYSGRKENVNSQARFYAQDVCNSRALCKIFLREKPSLVIHQAAQINLRHSVEDPAFDARINILGSLNVLECCRKHNVKKIVFASSGGAIYGEPEKLPCKETHPVNPLSPYGCAKYAIELYLYQYWKNYDLNYTALRYGNVFGPRQDPHGEAGVVAIFAEKMLQGQPPTIFGNGQQTRDFVFVEDVARANLKALQLNESGQAFNIGLGKETSVNQIFESLKRFTRFEKPALYGPQPKGEVQRIKLSIKKARQELNWQPKTTLKKGLKQSVKFFSDRLAQDGLH